MATQTIDKIINEVKRLPKNKLTSLLNYIHFLKLNEENLLTLEEENLIEKAEKEIKSGKGINWRKIKRNV